MEGAAALALFMSPCKAAKTCALSSCPSAICLAHQIALWPSSIISFIIALIMTVEELSSEASLVRLEEWLPLYDELVEL